MTAYPTWDQRDTYLAAARDAIDQVAADVADANTNVWVAIDEAIAQLHKLRSAAGSEHIRRHSEMVARMEAEDAARRARPAQPSDEVVEEARKLAEIGHPVLARLAVMNASSMTRGEAATFVASLSGSREGADR
jgi:hypothetical protein